MSDVVPSLLAMPLKLIGRGVLGAVVRWLMVVGRRLVGGLGVWTRVACCAAQVPVGAGLTVGAARLSDKRSEQVMTGVLQLRPAPWLTVSAIPSVVRVANDTSGTSASSGGLGDLPLVAGAAATLPGRWSPTLGGGGGMSPPPRDPPRGPGRGPDPVGPGAGAGGARPGGPPVSAGG